MNAAHKNTNFKENQSKFIDLEKILSGNITNEIKLNDFNFLNGKEIFKEKLGEILEIENKSCKDLQFLFAP